VLQDANRDLFLWSILMNQVFPFEEKSAPADVKWNMAEDDTFLLQYENELVPFVFVHQSIDGAFVTHVKNYKTLRDALENEDATLPNVTSTEKDLKLVAFQNHEALMFSSSDNSVRK